jgi:acyl carrier protein
MLLSCDGRSIKGNLALSKKVYFCFGTETEPHETMTTEQLQDWLRKKLSEETSADSKAIDLDVDFKNLDLDSLSAVSLAYELETVTGVVIDPTIFAEFRTPNELVQWIQLQRK